MGHEEAADRLRKDRPEEHRSDEQVGAKKEFVIHAGGMFLWFIGLPLTTLASMTALGFTGPIFVTIGAALFLGEDVRLRRADLPEENTQAILNRMKSERDRVASQIPRSTSSGQTR